MNLAPLMHLLLLLLLLLLGHQPPPPVQSHLLAAGLPVVSTAHDGGDGRRSQVGAGTGRAQNAATTPTTSVTSQPNPTACHQNHLTMWPLPRQLGRTPCLGEEGGILPKPPREHL